MNVRIPSSPAKALAACALALSVSPFAFAAPLPPLQPLPPFPKIPAPLPVNSVEMGDSNSFDEVKLADLKVAPGPFEPTWVSLNKNYPGTPQWLRDAKFGIWVHFGPQSAGESGDWYARYLYREDKWAYKNHVARYGHPSEKGYMEVLRQWNPQKLDPAGLTQLYKDAGARYLVIQGVHHDQFDMWNSAYQPWNSVRIGPKRDFIGEWAKAARANGLRFGLTFHHEYSWWWYQSAFMSDTTGPKAGVPYDGHLTLADGKGKWWEGMDPRMLYGIDLREYKGVADAATKDWTPAPNGIFTRHLDYAKWYSTWWALRMMDAVNKYDPDFIYTDGTSSQPFSGYGTGTGIKTDAMQRVIADFYNRTQARRGKVDVFSIVKFRHDTPSTVTTEESNLPDNIKTDQPWIAEVPLGDWFYGPNFTYDSGMMLRFIIEAAARDGNAAINIPMKPDGSLDEAAPAMLREVGAWMKLNGAAIYGSKAWKIAGEGQLNDKGALRKIPGGALRADQRDFVYSTADFRFTVGKDGKFYAICMAVPKPGEELTIKSLGRAALGKSVNSVTLAGGSGRLKFTQGDEGLKIVCPPSMPFKTAVVFKIE